MLRPLVLVLTSVVSFHTASAQNRGATAQKPVTHAATGTRKTVSHNRFTIDVTDIVSVPDRDSVIKAVKEQVDLVVNAKMPAATRAFFRTVPLVMTPVTGRPRYSAGRIEIPLHSESPFSRDRPILLHELCHAYHERKLEGGFDNPTILAFYDQAKKSGKFPADSYMLSSNPEYFAMMASVFLHGSALRDPFARDSIRVKQPAMYDWLVKEFGRR